MQNIYFISDLHFGHKGIIEYEKRPFKDVNDMNMQIINNWNKTVKKQDKVFVLGDVSFYNKDKTKAIINSLKGYKVLILGNHDRDRSLSWWQEAGFDEVIRYPIIFEEKIILSHEPQINNNIPFINIHGHIHGEQVRISDSHYNVSVECINYTPVRYDVLGLGSLRSSV